MAEPVPESMIDDKYIGLALAVLGTVCIGASFVITKKGLIQAQERHGFEGDGFTYLKSALWWGGIITMVVGEVGNFAAYAFAPAILVTPLGALSVLIGAVLGSYFLNEKLGILGKLGCAICLLGSLIIVLHAPPDEDIQRIDEMLKYALHPVFVIYCLIIGVFAVVMIYKVAPKYGRKNPMVYLSICSTVGSISVMAIKGFGIALKLTFAGKNQFIYPSTYVFMIVVVVCILTQMNYFNKALSQFSTSLVNPLYYVTFTTCTLIASFLLFRGFNTTSPINTISLLCGFLIIFSGVYLLNLSRDDPDGKSTLLTGRFSDGVPTDGIASVGTRRSLQARRSSVERGIIGGGGRRDSGRRDRGDSFREADALMEGFDEENAFGLGELADEYPSDEENGALDGRKRTSFDGDLSHGEARRNSKADKAAAVGGRGRGRGDRR